MPQAKQIPKIKFSAHPVILVQLDNESDENDDEMDSSVSFDDYYSKTTNYFDSLLDNLYVPTRRKRLPDGEQPYTVSKSMVPVHRPVTRSEQVAVVYRPMRTQRQSDVMSESVGPYAVIVVAVGMAVYLAFNLFSLAMGRSAKYSMKDLAEQLVRSYVGLVPNPTEDSALWSQRFLEQLHPTTRWWDEKYHQIRHEKARSGKVDSSRPVSKRKVKKGVRI